MRLFIAAIKLLYIYISEKNIKKLQLENENNWARIIISEKATAVTI
jgi:hypothetical protein